MSGGDARQLPLPLPVAAAMAAEDFLVADSNREAVRWIGAWPDWPGQAWVLAGPPASGKTHLAGIWRRQARAACFRGSDLTVEQALAGDGPVLVDDADRCPDARALLHLLNRARAGGHTVLLTGCTPPAGWQVTLADLASRLNALPVAALGPPDDGLLAGLVAKLFADRQMAVPEPVVAYMLRHLERSCAAIALAVERLDRAALADGVPVTRSLARRILDPSNGT
jgi:chromosomal replication initiation ATPase DnaA